MKRLPGLLIAALALISSACTSTKTTIQWKEGNVNPENGKAVDTLLVLNPPKEKGWNIWFCQFYNPVNVLTDVSDGDIDYWNGSLYRIFPTKEYKDTVKIIYEYRVQPRQSWAPEGFALQLADGTATNLEASYSFLPTEKVKDFEYSPKTLAVEDMIPQLKKVSHMDGQTTVGDYTAVMVPDQKSGWYRITLDGSVKVEAADEDGAYYAGITIDNLKRNAGSATLPNMVIEDWPDLPFRGLMLDVSRNFTKKDDVLKLLDILAHYKVNVFHLHFGDDEGWRVEIKGLDELTSYGGYRDVPVIDKDGNMTEPNGLMPSYSGGTRNGDIPGCGFYTREDYIEILKYAAERHIRVIPEFDTPGHSRAAVKAMEKRFERTLDTTYLLSEPTDTSKYMSVQDYTDNAINVALPSTYAFISKVFDELIAMHNEAGVPLTCIHIGGDEVPSGAWVGSPSCQKIMAENGWTNASVLKEYYMAKVMDIALSKGIKIAGWQDVTLHLSDEVAKRLPTDLEYTNLWSTLPAGRKEELPYKLANQGVNVVLSDVQSTYADLAYNYGRLERGHSWGGFVDERRAFSILPFDLYKSVRWDDYGKMTDISNVTEGKTKLNPGAEKHIIGIQCQLWTETIRNFDHVTYYLFPKIIGNFERGWNANPSWASTNASDDPAFVEAFDKFYSIIQERETSYFEQNNIAYRVHE